MDNTGLIIDGLRATDYMFGGFTPIKKDIINEDCDWWDEYSEGEVQIGIYFDCMGCVSFSALNALEAKFNWLIEHNRIGTENLLWLTSKGYINNFKINFSDRFTAKMSGTTHSGNSAQRVWDSIRKDGVVPEVMWSFPSAQRTPVFDWDDFYCDIPDEVKEIGKEFAKRFKILYEFVDKDKFKEVLKYSPIQVFIATQCPIENDIQIKCGNSINHAVSIPRLRDDINYIEIFDHYIKQRDKSGKEEFIRKVSKDYIVYPYGVACYIEELNNKKTMNIETNKLYLILTPTGQYLGMGLDSKLVVYENKVDTLINVSARKKEKHIVAPDVTVRLDDLKGVKIVNGKMEEITLK